MTSIRLDAEPLEHVAGGHFRRAAHIAEIDLLAVQLIQRRDAGIGAHQHVHFIVGKLGDVVDLVGNVAKLARAAEFAEHARDRNAEIDALEIANVADVLRAALADDRQDAEIVAVVENRRQVVGKREPSRVDIAGNDGDRVGVDLGAERAEIGLVRDRCVAVNDMLLLRKTRRNGNGCGQCRNQQNQA